MTRVLLMGDAEASGRQNPVVRNNVTQPLAQETGVM
jgi:hypothetical protein